MNLNPTVTDMFNPRPSCWPRPASTGWLAFAALAAAVLAFGVRSAPDAQAEIREQPAPRAFLSGGERSEILLREISGTLKRIDGRLERLERAVYETPQEGAGQAADAESRGEPDANAK